MTPGHPGKQNGSANTPVDLGNLQVGVHQSAGVLQFAILGTEDERPICNLVTPPDDLARLFQVGTLTPVFVVSGSRRCNG